MHACMCKKQTRNTHTPILIRPHIPCCMFRHQIKHSESSIWNVAFGVRLYDPMKLIYTFISTRLTDFRALWHSHARIMSNFEEKTPGPGKLSFLSPLFFGKDTISIVTKFAFAFPIKQFELRHRAILYACACKCPYNVWYAHTHSYASIAAIFRRMEEFCSYLIIYFLTIYDFRADDKPKTAIFRCRAYAKWIYCTTDLIPLSMDMSIDC